MTEAQRARHGSELTGSPTELLLFEGARWTPAGVEGKCETQELCRARGIGAGKARLTLIPRRWQLSSPFPFSPAACLLLLLRM